MPQITTLPAFISYRTRSSYLLNRYPMEKSDMTLLIISVTEIWKRSRFKSLYKDKFNKKKKIVKPFNSLYRDKFNQKKKKKKVKPFM